MGIMDVTFTYVIQALAVIIVVYEVAKKIMDIKKVSDEDHARRQGWDYAAQIIKEKEETWDKGLANVYKEREQIVEKYDDRLDEVDAKIQQLYAMMVLLVKSQNALFEERVEKGSNGEVKKMHDELNNFVVEQLGQ